MLDTLITSKTRIKLLLKFFLNAQTKSYLRSLEGEFGESTNAIRLELNKFEEAGMLTSSMEGNKKIYQANSQHPLFDDIHSIIKKYIGIDRVIEQIIGKVGQLEKVYLIGDYAKGIDSGVIELLINGKNIDEKYLAKLSSKIETKINRKISFSFSDQNTINSVLKSTDSQLLIWCGN